MTKTSEDMRLVSRRPMHIGEGVRFSLHWDNGNIFNVEAVDITPLGMGVVLEEAEAPEPRPRPGDTLKVQYRTLGLKEGAIQAVLVNESRLTLHGRRYLRWGVALQGPIGVVPKKGVWVWCNPLFLPLAYGDDPFFSDERLHFQILAISPVGLLLRTSVRNKTLIPGVHLHLNGFLPTFGLFPLQVRIIPMPHDINVDAHLQDPNALFLCAAWDQTPTPFLEAATAMILISVPSITVAQLKSAHFPLGKLWAAISVRDAIWEQDEEVLGHLRSGELAIGRDVSPKALFDEEDAYARHLICQVGATPVASLRLLRVWGDQGRSVYQKRLVWPAALRRQPVLEMSQLCWHKDYREGDVLVAMMRRVAAIALAAQVKYVVMACNAQALPLYKALGFQNTGLSFAGASPTHPMKLLTLDVRAVVVGQQGVTSKVWSKVYGRIQTPR